jgi:DNA-binding response OmpR family regulator
MDRDIHILVVDDNQENLKLVNNHLKEWGYKIALALNAKEALTILENHSIDLVLLDIMMPEIDGLEVCRMMKEKEKTKDIPVIFLTAKTETEYIVKAFKYGGVDYISKPFRKEELFARVKNHLENKIMRDVLLSQVEYTRESRNNLMKMLLDLGRMMEKED